ncbi:MAG: sigma factor-like helix-turn-helix DNA-binding protein, partial [Streptomyces sp.]
TTVTMRLCVDRYRQLNREAEVGSHSALAAPAPVPVEEVVCDRAEAKWLARRSRSLPTRQAEALRLKSEGFDVDQVATRMGLSYEATESLLARARRAMRSSLAGTLALAVWLVRGRPETGGAQVAAAASTAAVTLAVLGIALPYSDGGDRPRSPQVSRPEAVEEPARERGRDEPAPPPRSTARPDDGPTRLPGPRKPLSAATSLVPKLSAPATPEVPAVPAVPTVPSRQLDVKLPTVKPTPARPAVPTDAGAPQPDPTELPGSGALPTEVRKPLR